MNKQQKSYIEELDDDAKALLKVVAENIRINRAYKKLSQAELGDKCQLHRTYISDLENGKRNLSIASLVKLAKTLDVDVTELLVNQRRRVINYGK